MANYKIVISGYYGFNNAGDEAMLSAILQALQGTFDSPDIPEIPNPLPLPLAFIRCQGSAFPVSAVPSFPLI